MAWVGNEDLELLLNGHLQPLGYVLVLVVAERPVTCVSDPDSLIQQHVLVELLEHQLPHRFDDCKERVHHDEPLDERLDEILVDVEYTVINFEP